MIQIVNNDIIEVTTIKNFYKALGENDYELIRENVRSKKCIRISEICEVSQMLSDYGYPITNRTEIEIRGKEPLVVIGKYEDIKNIVYKNKTDYSTNIGYEYYKDNSSTI